MHSRAKQPVRALRGFLRDRRHQACKYHFRQEHFGMSQTIFLRYAAL